MTHIFKSQGILKYSIIDENNYKIALLVDPEIAKYYRSFVPKSRKCQPGRYAPHITVVRNECPSKMKKWGAYENKIIEFEYEPYVWYNGTYWWLNCYNSVLEQIRKELGLPIWAKWNMPPDGKACFHLTIGNSK